MASNLYYNISKSNDKIRELREQLDKLIAERDRNHYNYLHEVEDAIRKHPNLTAGQIAGILTDSADERLSIATSIGLMAHHAEDYRKHGRNADCQNPAIPNLHRKTKTIKRNFVELDEDGNPIGKFSMTEEKYVYSM